MSISTTLVSSRTVSDACWLIFIRLINQRLMEEQSQVEELQRSVQEQGSSAEDVSSFPLSIMAEDRRFSSPYCFLLFDKYKSICIGHFFQSDPSHVGQTFLLRG